LVKRRTGRIKDALVQIYTGAGKGKTTAALGLAMRAIGHGYRVRMIQFMKGTTYTGELRAAERLGPGLEIYQFGRDCQYSEEMAAGTAQCTGCGDCFVRRGEVTQADIELAAEAYVLALRTLKRVEADIVILDEISNALEYELLSVGDVVKLVGERPPGVELVLTGRNMPPELIQVADLVTEMHMVKHPFEKGIPARRGIEY
jgi:cob(I)alamin adenosyltransferase